MRSYSNYKESGIKWLEEIPTSWTISKLKYLTNFINGAAIKPEFWGDIGLPVIRIQNLNGNERYNYVDPNAHKIDPKVILEGGELLFSWSGNIGTSFGPFLWKENVRAILNQHIFKLDDYHQVDKTFFYYLLIAVTKYIESKAHGIIGMVHITKRELGNIPVPLPSRDEQIFIASFLDEQITNIDKVIKKKKRLIKLLKKQRQALINESVMKGLDLKVPLKDSGIKILGEVPTHWEIVKFKHVVKLSGRLGWKGLKAEEYTESGYGFLSTPDIKKREIDYNKMHFISEERYLESPEIMLKEGDVLLVKDGSTLGIVNMVKHLPVPSTVNSSIAVLRVDSIRVLPGYLRWFIASDHVQHVINLLKAGQGVPHLFQKDIKNFDLLVPPLQEQKDIVDYIERQLDDLDRLIHNVRMTVDKLKLYKQSLIFEAVTGKIDVREFQTA